MVFVTCWLAFIAVTSVIGYFTKNLFNESDTTGKEEDLTSSKKKRTRKRKNIDPHEYCGEYKIQRKEVHAQWIHSLANCTEVKFLGEGSFGKVSLYCHNDTKMNFAVKQINAFDQESYEMERKILALGRSTRNHFLSTLWGEFFDEDCFYLVLELMFAGDLETIFRFHAKIFSEMQARFYIAEVICGLQYLHT